MGLLSRFGVGGGTIDIALENAVVAPGGELRGNVLFRGGKRSQEITNIKLAAWCTLSSPPTPGAQARSTTQVVAPARDVCGKITVQAGETKTFPFSITIPQGSYGTTPDLVRYHLHTSADIDKEIDPGDTQDFVVQGPAPPPHALPAATPNPPAQGAAPQATAAPVAAPVAAPAFSPPASPGHAPGGAPAFSPPASPGYGTAPSPGFAPGVPGPTLAIGTTVLARYHDHNWYAGRVMATQPGRTAVQWADERMGLTWVDGSGLRAR